MDWKNIETEIRVCKDSEKGKVLEICQKDYSGKRMKFNYVLVPLKDVKKVVE